MKEQMRTLRVATYNICHAGHGGRFVDDIGNLIKEEAIDIIGLQEVDYQCNRTNQRDIASEIARSSQLKYYQFFKAMDYQGGEYGLAVLSRFPIVGIKSIALSHAIEPRICAKALIDCDGMIIPFYNTHLELGAYDEARQFQLAEVANFMEEEDAFILVGDFNVSDWRESHHFEYTDHFNAYQLINNQITTYATYRKDPQQLVGEKPIDNIVLSDNVELIESNMVPRHYSDHHILIADVLFKEKTNVN